MPRIKGNKENNHSQKKEVHILIKDRQGKTKDIQKGNFCWSTRAYRERFGDIISVRKENSFSFYLERTVSSIQNSKLSKATPFSSMGPELIALTLKMCKDQFY